jgi:hypothetical protein
MVNARRYVILVRPISTIVRALTVVFSSVALFIIAILWAYSQDTKDVFVFSKATLSRQRPCRLNTYAIGVGRGCLILYHYDYIETLNANGATIERKYASGRWVFERQRNPVTANPRALPWHGFKREVILSRSGWPQERDSTTFIPLWLFALIFSAYPVIAWVQRTRKTERVAAGRCPQCGYDLRASPARCPECGYAVVGSSTRSVA